MKKNIVKSTANPLNYYCPMNNNALLKPSVICTMDSPVGLITVTECQQGVIRLDFDDGTAALSDPDLQIIGRDRRFFDDHTTSIPARALFFDSATQISEYLNGKRKAFALPIGIRSSGRPFSDAVYEQLKMIPYGTVLSYAQVAALAGSPKAARAVGNANAHNKIPIILPCHRVITADGHLGGYAGGHHISGTAIKKKLLLLEGISFDRYDQILCHD